MNARRRWRVALWVAVVTVGVVRLVMLWSRHDPSADCATTVVGARQVPTVFAAPSAAVVRDDHQLTRLIAGVQRSGLGQVIGGVGYDQAQWLHSAGVHGGFATWTSDAAVIGFPSATGVARWGLKQTADPQAWALAGGRFLDLDLRPGTSVEVTSFDPQTGSVGWCADVGKATRYGDPLTVAPGGSRSVWVVTAGPTLSRIDAAGRVTAQRRLAGVDRAGFVQQVGSMLVVGGRADHLLTAPDPNVPAPEPGAAAVTAFDAKTLEPIWHWGSGEAAHVVGVGAHTIVIEVVRDGRISVVGLSLDGSRRWTTALHPGTTSDMSLSGPDRGILLVRTSSSLSGYETSTGRLRWTRPVAADTFPVGFSLDAQPSLGSGVLLGTTSAIVLMDPSSGALTRYPLPRAGSAFWPYEITVSRGSQHSAIVETNAGAVLVALRPHPN